MDREETLAVVQQNRLIHGLPGDTTLLSSDETGAHQRRAEEKRIKLLETVRFLARFLEPGEKIAFVTTACSPFGARERRAHAVSFLLRVKRCILVFTDRRIFHVLTTPKYEYRASIAQIFYADCRSLHVDGTSLWVEYRTGKKEEFRCIPKEDGAIIGRVDMGASGSGGVSDCPERNHLCPRCTRILEPDTIVCSGCGLEFKSRRKAMRYAWLLPGRSYFYLGRWDTAIGYVLAELLFFSLTIMTLYVAVTEAPGLMLGVIMYALMLAYGRVCAVYGANHFAAEFIPVDMESLVTDEDRGPRESLPLPGDRQEKTAGQVLSVRHAGES